MNRRVVFISFALLALAGFFVWLLRAHLRDEKAHQLAVLTRAGQKKQQLPPPPIDGPQPVLAAQYLDIAQHMLFSKDRNPTEVVEVKAPPPKPPLPPLPSYFGQIRLGEPAILLCASNAQQTYHAGDQVGDKDKYVIVSFDQEKIKLAFNDESVEKKLDDLRPKDGSKSPCSRVAQAAPKQQPQAARPQDSSAVSLGSNEKKDEVIGADYGSGFHGCVAGDNSPDGTIKDGYRKVISHTLFGQNCHWETVK
jgi:hypothetical protein